MYRDWNTVLTSAIRQVDEFNTGSLFATSSPYENLAGSMKELANNVRDFREDPKKYLRLKIF
jgi:hypothetical protein